MALLPLLLLPLLLPPASPAPNIVLMLADDLGWNDLSWHNPRVISPHLASLASAGITLEQHYSQPVCSPTRGALLTGRYPIHIGLNQGIISPLHPHGLPTNLTTLAELLQEEGYSTHAVGKWHLGFCRKEYLPTHRGFDHHYGYWLGAQDYYEHTRTTGNDVGYDFREDVTVDYSAVGNYSTTLYGQRAATIIREHNQSSPLFLYLPFQAVHGPLQVPQLYSDLYLDVEDAARRTYLGMVTAMDYAVGEVVAALKETNMFEDTIIVFMSDNGGSVPHHGNNWPLRGSKGSVWEGGTRTPAFVHQPGVLGPRVEWGLVHVTDWLPTLLQAAGVAPPEGLDGVGHWAELVEEAPLTRTELLYNYKARKDEEEPVAGLRWGSWKYLWSVAGFDGWQPAPEDQRVEVESKPAPSSSASPHHYHLLFDLLVDPEERNNLAEEQPQMVVEMEARLAEMAEGVLHLPDSATQDDPAGNPSLHGGVWRTGWC